MSERQDLIALAAKIVEENADTRPKHQQIIEKAMSDLGLKPAENPEELLDFLASRVQYWAHKSEGAVNAGDFRNCKAEAQLALLLYQLAKPRNSPKAG